MDSISIKQLVDQQLAKKGITDGAVHILERKWGYVVQINYANNRARANELFDKDGNVIYPLSNFQLAAGGVYSTEVVEVIAKKYTQEIMERIKGTAMEEELKRTIAVESSVLFRELDDNHFIIPHLDREEKGNALFFVEQDNSVTYKGYIKGSILDSILTEDKKLMEQKQVLSSVTIDKTRDEYEYFFFSWDKNCRVSDKWSKLYKPKDTFNALEFLMHKMKLPEEFSLEIVNCMQSNDAWLATLNLNSKDNRHHEYFVCLIGIDGLPLIDLKYISQIYEVKTIPLKKEKIGEVDNIKTLLQKKLDQTISQIEKKKNANEINLTANFLKGTCLDLNDEKFIANGIDTEDEKNYIMYDDTYLGPGFFIINKQGDIVVKYLKIFIMNNQGFPNYGVRAFSIHGKDNPDNEYTTIDFTFSDIEDDENGLYQIFNNLCIDLNGDKVETIDKFYQGKNHFSLSENDRVVTLSIAKDIYGVKDATDFIDINIGDDMTCPNYNEISTFYNQLANSQTKQATEEDIKQLLRTRLK